MRAAASILLCIYVSPVFSQTLDEVVRLQTENYERIKSLSCQYQIRIETQAMPEGKLELYGRFSAKGPRAMIREGRNGIIQQDCLIEDRLVRILATQWSKDGTTRQNASKHPLGTYYNHGYITREFLLNHYQSGTDRCVSLEEFYRINNARIVSKSIEKLVSCDGKEYGTIAVELSYKNKDDSTVVLRNWHAVDHQMLIVQQQREFKNQQLTRLQQLGRFVFVSDATIPTLSEWTYRNLEKTTEKGICKLLQVKLNEPLAESEFQLATVPPGTLCSDQVKMTKYQIGTDWKPIGKEVPFQPIAAQSASERSPAQDRHATLQEPTSWAYWLMVASGGVFLTSLIILISRWIWGRIRRNVE